MNLGWLRAPLDLLTLGLAALAACVAAFGGLRWELNSIGISATSAWRLLLWAVVATVVRHLIAPRPSLLDGIRDVSITTARSRALRAALLALVFTRVPVLIVGLIALAAIGYRPGGPLPFRYSGGELRNLPARWDSGWYLSIATEGYRWTPNPELRQNLVFFPAYPLLIRGLVRLLGDRPDLYVPAGLFITLGAFLWAMTYLHRLAREDLDDQGADTAVLLTAAFPFAVFFSAIYTEALFLLAVTGAYWSLITSRYKAAFLWGLVAGLTRPTGLMLAPALLILIWQKRREVARPLAAVGAALAPLAGTILFSIYVYRLSGNPLTWMLGHGAWGRGTREVGAALWAHFRLVASRGVDGYVLAAPLSVMNAAAVILALASVIPLIRRGRASYAAFVVLALVPPLAMDGLMSTGRFTSVLFPVFVWIASVTTGPSRAAWMVSFGLGQGLAAVLFYTWRPMY